MNPLIQLVIFTLDGQHFALELAKVQRVVRALEVTPLPNAPAVILGVVNLHGEIASVVNLRHRFRLPTREISPDDQFILVNLTSFSSSPVQSSSSTRPALVTRKLALVVDAVKGLVGVDKESIVVGDEVLANMEHLQGMAQLADDLILIHNLERCLSLHEAQLLDEALAGMDA